MPDDSNNESIIKSIKMKKNFIIYTIVLLSIGFASISATLIINSNAKIMADVQDFDVYFSEAIVDGSLANNTISQDRKSITYTTKELKNLGDESTLEYVVTNNSLQYDAKVEIKCTPSKTDYLSISNEMTNNIIESGSTENGDLVVRLDKIATSSINTEFTCTIVAEAIERNSTGTPISAPCNLLGSSSLEKGSKVSCGTESFFITSFNDESIKMLSEYNLNVGYKMISSTVYEELENASGIQDSQMLGYTGQYPYYGIVPFSTISTDYNTSSIKVYVDNYLNYLTENIGLSKQTTEASLITLEELEELGCSRSNNSCSNSPYSWVSSVSYWTRTAHDSNSVWHVSTRKYIGYDYTYSYIRDYGVRPVITISVNDINM